MSFYYGRYRKALGRAGKAFSRAITEQGLAEEELKNATKAWEVSSIRSHRQDQEGLTFEITGEDEDVEGEIVELGQQDDQEQTGTANR